jgi:hypothetical protein
MKCRLEPGDELQRHLLSCCLLSPLSIVEKKSFVTLFHFRDKCSLRHLYEKWGFKLVEEHESDTWDIGVKEQKFEWVR